MQRYRGPDIVLRISVSQPMRLAKPSSGVGTADFEALAVVVEAAGAYVVEYGG